MHLVDTWRRPALSVCVLAAFVVLAFGSFFPVGKVSEDDEARSGDRPTPSVVFAQNER